MTGGAVIQVIPAHMRLVREIEDELGAIPALLDRFSGSAWMVTELVSLIHILLSAEGREEDYDVLGEKMISEGLEGYRRAALLFLKKVVTS